VDFGTFQLPWGRRYALLVVLGYSRLLWMRFYARQTFTTLIGGLESAFEFFGGVPQELLFDQMRSDPVRRDSSRLTESTSCDIHVDWVESPPSP
jgi:transposase